MPDQKEIEPLKPGYKLTEMGVLPEDWEITPFCELMDFRNGVNADKEAYGTGIRFVNVLEAITHTHLHAGDIPGRVMLSKSAIDSFSIRKGDIVFNRTSETQEEVGLASVYLDDDDVVFGGFVIRGRPKTNSLDPAFAGYALRSPRIRSQVVSKGQGAIRANIGQTDLRQVLAILPPLPEQRAIAAALGDVDALIGALDRLIAKKRDLKQAAMQQLLTGQTRLPGFRGEWEIRSLLSAVTPAAGQVDPKQAPYGSMVLIAPDHVECETGKLIEKRTASEQGAISGKYVFNPGDIVYSKIRPYLRKAILADFHGLCSADMYPLSPAKDVYPAFVFAVLLGHHFSTFAMTVSVRSGIPKINREELAQYSFALPPLPEQTAIAAVLSDMDAEITALEARRDKTRLLKQGMMQELLTGKTRLV